MVSGRKSLTRALVTKPPSNCFHPGRTSPGAKSCPSRPTNIPEFRHSGPHRYVACHGFSHSGPSGLEVVIRAESTLRGLEQGDHDIFALHFTWSAGTRTSLHKHRGFEFVLVRNGRVNAILNGTSLSAGPAEFIELPAGSAHAIWSEVETTFDVLGQRGLGLTMLVPDG